MIELASRTLRVVALLAAGVGAVDAARGPHWDQFAMLAAIVAVLAVDLALDALRPATVAVRADQLAWLAEEAGRTDDTVGLVAGRAIAAYRASRPASPAPARRDS